MSEGFGRFGGACSIRVGYRRESGGAVVQDVLAYDQQRGAVEDVPESSQEESDRGMGVHYFFELRKVELQVELLGSGRSKLRYRIHSLLLLLL